MSSSDLTEDRLRMLAEQKGLVAVASDPLCAKIDVIVERKALARALLAAREEIAKLRVLTGDRTARQEAARLYAKGYNAAVRGGYSAPPIAPEIARLTRERDEAHIRWRERVATHRCKVCGAKWIDCGFVFGDEHDAWSLASRECGPCCDNVAMGEQIEPIGVFARVVRLRERLAAVEGALREVRPWAGRSLDGHGRAAPVDHLRSVIRADLTPKEATDE